MKSFRGVVAKETGFNAHTFPRKRGKDHLHWFAFCDLLVDHVEEFISANPATLLMTFDTFAKSLQLV